MNDLTQMPINEIRSKKISEPCSDTGEWFLSDDRFKLWQDTPESSLLWVKGSPGQGKSVLAKIALKNLEDRVLGGDYVVVYFFCFQKKEYFGRATDILQALIIQLIDCQELYQHLPTRYIEDDAKFLTAPLASLWDLLYELVVKIGHRHIYCVIDALDECMEDNGQRSDLLRNLAELVSMKQKHVKVLITSRPGEQDINAELQRFPTLELQAHTEDLRAVISTQVEKLPSDSFDDNLKREIEKGLQTQAGRTFLWVTIVINEIAALKFPSMRDVKEILAENPRDLDALYEKLVARIIENDNPQKILQKLLYWVAYSERELSIEELNEVIMCDPDLGTYKSLSERDEDRRQINRQDIREHLGTLLEVETKFRGFRGSQDFVYFNHQSVYDYFQGVREKAFNGKVDLFLARTCLRYLNAEEFYRPMLEQRYFARHRPSFNLYPFLDYASTYWYKHIKTTEDAKSEWGQIRNLFDYEKPLKKLWIERANLNRYNPDPRRETTMGWLAIRFDISWLTELIISGDCGGATTDFEVSQILAMLNEAPKSFECFVRASSDEVSASSEVIEAVARSPSAKKSMKLLLENQASNVLITEDLMVAAASNECEPFQSEGLVRLLFDHKAAATCEITEKLLIVAARNPDESLMQLLLTNGKDEIKITESIVTAAVENPNEMAIQLLLDNPRNRVRVTEGIFMAAAANWNEKVIRLLLADKRNQLKITQGIVTAAAGNRNEKVIQLLLTIEGNEIKITEGIVMAAAGNRNEVVIQLLLTDKRNEIRITERVLMSAAVNTNERVMRLLLTIKRETVKITEDILILAAANRNHCVIQLLLTEGGNETKITERILISAVASPEVMRLLLKGRRNHEIKITQEIFSAAMVTGHKEVQGLLLQEQDGNLDITDSMLETAASEDPPFMLVLLEYRSQERQITQEVVLAAAGDCQLLQRLMERHARGLKFTDTGLFELRRQISRGQKVPFL